ncbi:microfibril-associated glycoprotein 4-like [Anopheles ziemanni]|uniref:microfibril-associated glycoprotein 4-like n=1 Tax=Anopheles coustani TaxID=139045 RepID=UPI0026589FB9|nr:microfibril-associated glycoprotein 4-like [Anopheles coustani]XP_058178561.1 microfibril-associated glycoprotein 4-like [Anopheles ziemanni]
MANSRTNHLITFAAFFIVGVVRCEEVSRSRTDQNSSSAYPGGFSFEIIMTKLQVLEYNVDRMAKSITQLVETTQPLIAELRGSNFTSCSKLPVNVSGIYKIQPEKPFKQPMSVLRDQEYESGGWTVIQQRFDGSVDFYRGWQEYKNGFGSLEGEFWLGLDRIHQLTASKPNELVVLLEDFDGNRTYARYERFSIGDEAQKYLVASIDGYSGTAGNAMSGIKGVPFTTLDSDNDTWYKNCAVQFTGAWWYTACHSSNLNGRYLRGETKEYASGMVWYEFRGHYYALKSSKMMIRSKE